MPHKNKADRNAYQRAKYARNKAEDPDFLAKQAAKMREHLAKKAAEDARFLERRRATYKKWYDEHGKQNARERKGYVSWEEYEAAVTAKRKASNEYMKQWGKTPAGQRARTARTILKRCGLSIEDYDKTYDSQSGKCRICEKEKNRYGKDRLVVDHCHKSGNFRALLCGMCNAAIGMLEESPVILRNAIQYLGEVCL